MKRLMSSDGVIFEVDEATVLQSRMLRNMNEDDNVTPVDIHSNILKMVIEYCRKHSQGDPTEEFDAEFVNVDRDTLLDLLSAAHLLAIRNLVDLLCQATAKTLMEKNPDELNSRFGIKTFFTDDEEEKLRADYERYFD